MSARVTWTAEMMSRAAGMKRAGLSSESIAGRLGLTVSTLNRKLRQIGAYCHLGHQTGPVRKAGRLERIRLVIEDEHGDVSAVP